jgi:hypothetical protein
VAEVRALWDWLETNQRPSWGRVYLQDTFLLRLNGERLIHSHVLARTSYEAGVRQLGAFYKAVPLPTSQWTGSDRGRLFESLIRTAEDVRGLRTDLQLTNCTHLVVADPGLADALTSVQGFQERFRSGRFAVFELAGASAEWCRPLSEGLRARTAEYRAGDIEVEVNAHSPGATLLVKESFHPFWKVEGTGAERVEAHVSGLMVVKGIGKGKRTLRLRWTPPRYPAWISIAGVLVLLGSMVATRGRKK